MLRKTPGRLTALCALLLCVGACSDDPSSPPEDGEIITDYVASVSVDDLAGTLRTGAVPRPTEEGPAISVDGHLTIVNGGTAELSVVAPTPFETVYVARCAPTSRLFTEVNGFFEIPLPAPTTAADLLIVFPQALPQSTFDLYFAVADTAGNVGTQATRSVEAFVVGTGDIQVTARWDANSDVDLHVIDPGGWEIYWGERQAPSGGELDLDSNAACMIDGVRNENITWPVGTAPQGTYTVRLDYWSSCDESETNYTVLINNGGDVSIHRGTFSGEGDSGGAGSGIEIATFTRSTGPAAPARTETIAAMRRRPTTK